MVSLSEFWDMLNQHDWYHVFSDSWEIDQRGAENRAKLLEIAHQSDAHTKLFIDFENHYWTGKPWGTEQAPKPERPV
jgi:hypothetical protein